LDIQLEDQAGRNVASFGPGESIRVRAVWQTTDLPAESNYDLRFSVNGVDLFTTDMNDGAGASKGGNSWSRWGWYAGRPGTQYTVRVTIDFAGEVAETSEADNTRSLTWTVPNSTDLPSKLVWPVAGRHNFDWRVSAYVDLDLSKGFRDFRGGPVTYDGHDAIDIAIPNFGAMDRGTAVLAAAKGTVVYANDGGFDRYQLKINAPEPHPKSNTIIIDHGNGWWTLYAHLASGSLTVRKNDVVSAGQQIALVGSSGLSDGAHLHFTVFRHFYMYAPDKTKPQVLEPASTMPVETMIHPELYYVVPASYQRDVPAQVEAAGITNIDTDPDYRTQEVASEKRNYSVTGNDVPRVWFARNNLRNGDVTRVRWLRPDGSTAETDTSVSAVDGYDFRTFLLNAANWRQFPGTWTAVIEVNGRELRREQFRLLPASSTPEIRVSLGQRQIPDGRTSPINFGTVSVGSGIRTWQFRIENHGDGPLKLSGLSLPKGFVLASAFPTSISAGGSSNFTISMPTGAAGRFLGDLRFATNDSDEQTFNFVLVGEVLSAGNTGQPDIVPSGRAAVFRNGSRTLVDPSTELRNISPGSLNGALLQIWIASGGKSGDQLSIIHQGNAKSQIGISGTTIRFEGIVIGSVAILDQSQLLNVTLNSNATLAGVQSMLRRIGFIATVTPFSAERRTIGMQAIWNNGSKSLLKTISVIGATPQTIAPPVLQSPPAVTTSKQPAISWVPVTGALGYEVLIRRRSSPSVPLLVKRTMQTSLIPAVPLPIGDLQVLVRTIYPSGQFSAWSPARSFQIR
jgi:murein DD-endopeptidase MepM/ murein hydrolase activator NlpD